MIWNWQQKKWPGFQYDCSALGELEGQFLRLSGVLQGTLKHIKDLEMTDWLQY
jgi:hypothetical protein